jgi:L-ascorbate metabolism protein UlaG (beta-lactamase superfamily)
MRGRGGAVVTDPYPPNSGYKLGKPSADIVTVCRHDEPGYSFTDGVASEARVLDAPGEYEIGGILVRGVATRQSDGSRNVIFVCELDGVRVGHLGLLQEAPSVVVLNQLEDVDVLLLPIGGYNALSATLAQDVMTSVDPPIVIPMNYGTAQEKLPLEPLDKFLREVGSRPEPQPKLSVSRSSLPSELALQVLLLKQ